LISGLGLECFLSFSWEDLVLYTPVFLAPLPWKRLTFFSIRGYSNKASHRYFLLASTPGRCSLIFFLVTPPKGFPRFCSLCLVVWTLYCTVSFPFFPLWVADPSPLLSHSFSRPRPILSSTRQGKMNASPFRVLFGVFFSFLPPACGVFFSFFGGCVHPRLSSFCCTPHHLP